MGDTTEDLQALLSGPAGEALLAARPDVNLRSALDLLAEWREQGSADSSLMRVVLVGQFNAGKSTIANALLARELAFTDPFEASSCVTVFRPDTAEYAELHRESGRERVPLAEYVRLCERRELSNVRFV